MDAYWTPMVYKNQAPINNCSQEGRIQHAEWRTETPTIVDVVRHYGYYCVAELCIFYGSLTPIDNFNINFRQGWTHTHIPITFRLCWTQTPASHNSHACQESLNGEADRVEEDLLLSGPPPTALPAESLPCWERVPNPVRSVTDQAMARQYLGVVVTKYFN